MEAGSKRDKWEERQRSEWKVVSQERAGNCRSWQNPRGKDSGGKSRCRGSKNEPEWVNERNGRGRMGGKPLLRAMGLHLATGGGRAQGDLSVKERKKLEDSFSLQS